LPGWPPGTGCSSEGGGSSYWRPRTGSADGCSGCAARATCSTSVPTLITDRYTEYLKLVDELRLADRVVHGSPLVGVVAGRPGELTLHVLHTSRPLRSFLGTRLLSARAKLRLVGRGLRLIKPLHRLNPYELSSHVHYDTESIQD